MNNTVAVVIINWNGQKLLKRFLPSVINFSEEAKIYIIDNFSTDNSIQFVNKNYPKIKIINLNKNYGYAEGYNLGLKHVKEDIYILLNNDIEVTKNWIKPIIENFKHNKIDIAQPLLLDLKNPDYFDYSGAGGGFIDKYGYPYCRGRIYDKIEKNLNQYNNTFRIFWASGACFIIRKKFLINSMVLIIHFLCIKKKLICVGELLIKVLMCSVLVNLIFIIKEHQLLIIIIKKIILILEILFLRY